MENSALRSLKDIVAANQAGTCMPEQPHASQGEKVVSPQMRNFFDIMNSKEILLHESLLFLCPSNQTFKNQTFEGIIRVSSLEILSKSLVIKSGLRVGRTQEADADIEAGCCCYRSEGSLQLQALQTVLGHAHVLISMQNNILYYRIYYLYNEV